MAKRIDFVKFINEHEEEIFGKSRLRSSAAQYRKQINALDMKMNELIEKKHPMASDPVRLLGLFALAINEFGTAVKTDPSNYKDDFLALFEKGEE